MKKQNLLVLGIAIALIAVVVVLGAVLPQNRVIPENAPSMPATEALVTEPTEAPVPEATEVPAAEPQTTASPADEPAAPAATEMPPVEAYLVMSVQGGIYEPLPLAGEGSFTIRQDDGTTNTVHVTPTSVWMEHSSCDNQDCVYQGVVDLENKSTRVLQNMIICLPNEVVLELYTPEEVAQLLLSMVGYTGEEGNE